MNPYWLEDEIPPRPSTRIEGRVDVAIVGGGITGCSAALRLAEEGLRVRLYEQRGIAEGASGRNGGFALPGGATRYDIACETYGRETAQRFWRWTEEEAVLAGGARRRRVPGARQLSPRRRRGGAGADSRRVRRAARRRLRGRVARRPRRRAGRAVPRRDRRTRRAARSSRRGSSGGSPRAPPRPAPTCASTSRSTTSRRSTPIASSSRPTATGTVSSPSSPTRSGRRAAR